MLCIGWCTREKLNARLMISVLAGATDPQTYIKDLTSEFFASHSVGKDVKIGLRYETETGFILVWKKKEQMEQKGIVVIQEKWS